MKILLSKAQWEYIGRQAGWGNSNDSNPSQLAQMKHKVQGLIFYLTKTHGFTRKELIEYLVQQGVVSGDFSSYTTNAEQTKKIIESLELLSKDMKRLDNDFGVKEPELKVV